MRHNRLSLGRWHFSFSAFCGRWTASRWANNADRNGGAVIDTYYRTSGGRASWTYQNQRQETHCRCCCHLIQAASLQLDNHFAYPGARGCAQTRPVEYQLESSRSSLRYALPWRCIHKMLSMRCPLRKRDWTRETARGGQHGLLYILSTLCVGLTLLPAPSLGCRRQHAQSPRPGLRICVSLRPTVLAPVLCDRPQGRESAYTEGAYVSSKGSSSVPFFCYSD